MHIAHYIAYSHTNLNVCYHIHIHTCIVLYVYLYSDDFNFKIYKHIQLLQLNRIQNNEKGNFI